MTIQTHNRSLAAVVEQAIEAYNAKDFERYESFFAEDLHFCHHNRGHELHDRQSLVDTLRTFATSLIPDRQLGPAKHLVQEGNVVIRQQTWTGTAAVDVAGMAAAGETVSLDLCSVFVFDGEVIAEYHDFG